MASTEKEQPTKNRNTTDVAGAKKLVRYRIQLTVAVYKSKKLSYRNDMIVPTSYTRRSEARAHIKREIADRLRNTDFFVSPRVDYDLVRYANEASCNTYLRYRIIEDRYSPVDWTGSYDEAESGSEAR